MNYKNNCILFAIIFLYAQTRSLSLQYRPKRAPNAVKILSVIVFSAICGCIVSFCLVAIEKRTEYKQSSSSRSAKGAMKAKKAMKDKGDMKAELKKLRDELRAYFTVENYALHSAQIRSQIDKLATEPYFSTGLYNSLRVSEARITTAMSTLMASANSDAQPPRPYATKLQLCASIQHQHNAQIALLAKMQQSPVLLRLISFRSDKIRKCMQGINLKQQYKKACN